MKRILLNTMVFSVIGLYSFLFASGYFVSRERTEGSLMEKQQTVEMLQERERVARERLEEHPDSLAVFSLGFMAVLALGLTLDIAILSRMGRRRRDPASPVPALWTPLDVFYSLMFLLFIEAAIFFGLDLIRLAAGFEGQLPDSALLLTSLARDLAVALFVWVIVRSQYSQGARELGLRAGSAPPHVQIVYGLLGYVAMLPPLLIIFALLAAVVKHFSIETPPQNIVQIYLSGSSEPFLIPLTFFVAIAGPIMEEIFFRGFVYGGLRARFGGSGAAVLSSTAFAALHMHWVAFLPIFALGMFFARLYERTGSLVPSIAAHAFHNTVMVVLTLTFKQLTSPA